MEKYKNIKTGKFYALLCYGTDATNSRDGLIVVIYSPEDNPHKIFIRDEKEFYSKFIKAGMI
jgi:hypothetical protein